MSKNKSSNSRLQHVRETIYIKKFSDDLSHGTLSFVSDNIERLIGYKPEDFYKKPGLWLSIIHPEDAKEIEERFTAILSKGASRGMKKALKITYRIRHKKTRKYLYVEDAIAFQSDKHGREIGLVGSLAEIRMGKKSEEADVKKKVSLEDMFKNATVGIYRTTQDGRILYINKALLKMLGVKTLRELRDRNLNDESYEPQYSREEFKRRIESEGVISGLEATWKKKDGTLLFVRESARVVRGENGDALYYEGTVEDLTNEKLAEKRIIRLNQILRVLADINQLIVRNSTPEVLFNEACSILVRDGEYRMAWIGVLDENGGVVHPIAWNGVEDSDLQETIIIGDGRPQNFGLIGEAVRTGLASVCNDLWNDPAFKTRRREAKQRGYRSAGAFPIRVSGKVVGIVNVFAGQTNNFTSEEVRLLSEVADDIGFALWTIEVRAKEKVANDAIKDREFWLSESQRVARVGSYIFDVKSGTYTASSVLDEIFGIQANSRHDVNAFIALVHPGDREDFSRYLQGVLSEKKSFDFEYRIVRANDKVERWVWGKGELMLDSAGEPVTMFGTIQDVTDRKQIEEAHRQERILLRTVVDNLPSAIFVKDNEYRKTLVNSQHVERLAAHLGLLGLDSMQDLLGKTDFEVYPKELAEKYFEDDRRIIRDGESVLNREESVVNADGRKSWFFMSKVPLRDKNGKILGLVGISTDMTQLKEAEEAAKQERILLRTVIDNIPHAVYVKDSEYRKIIANPADIRNMGLKSEAEAIGKTDFDFFSRELAEKYFVDDEPVIKEGRSIVNREEYVIMSDGSLRWLLTTKVPLRGGNGNVTGLVGIGIDVTDHRKTEELLKESEERFRTIFENASVGIYRTTPDGRILFANPAMIRILGFKNLDELAKYNLEEGHNVSGYPNAKFCELVEAEGSVTGLESKKTRKDGSSFWVRENAQVVRDKEGKIICYEGTLEDITDRRLAEETLEHERTLLRTLIDHMPASVFVKDKEYRKTVVNNMHLQHMVAQTNRPELGSESAIVGKTDFDVYPREEAERYFLDDQQVIRDGLTILNREEPRTSPDGKNSWISISKIPLRDKAGEIIGMLGIISDVSDRRVAEYERERERILLRTLVDHLPNAVFVKNREYRKILVNHAHELAVKKALAENGESGEKEILGHTDFEVYPKKLAEEYFLEDQKVIEEGKSVLDREYCEVDRDGDHRWTMISKIPLRDEKGDIAGLLGITTDITAIKKNEEAISRERILLRTLIDNLPLAVYVKDTSYRKVITNPVETELCHCSSEEEVIGKTDFEHYPKESAEQYFLDDQRVIKNGEPVLQKEELHYDSNGKERWILTSKVPLKNEMGAITGLVGVGVDITEQKRLETALRKSDSELRALFASMKDVVLVLDRDGRYLEIAPTDPTLLYKPARELIGKTLHENFSPQQANEFLEIVRKALDTGESQTTQYKLEIAGKEIWFDASLSKIGEDRILVVARDITGHKQAEDALRKSEQMLKQITNSVDDAIYSIDGQTAEFSYLSPVFERKLGYSLSEIKEMGGRWAFMRKSIQSESLREGDPIIEDLQKQVITEVPIYENWWKCKDGTLLYLEDKSVPVYDGDRLIRVDGVLRDITEWKLSEDAKQRERNLLRTLIDNIPYPIYVKDKECRKIVANPADIRNMGLKSEAEAIGKTDFELYPKEIAERFFENDQAVVRDGKAVLNREEYLFGSDGKKRWLLTTKMPWLDENGRIIGLVGMGADITEMKAAEDALRQSEKELRMLFESMRDIILVLDKDGRFMRVSPTDDSLLFKPAAEIVGKTGHEIFPKNQAEYFLSIIRKTLKSEQTQNAEYAINIRGEEKWRVATISPLTNETVLWVARDITERKLMEKEISDSEKKYRELVENALIGVYRMTLSGKIIYANKAMADMLEYDSQEDLMAVTSFSLYKHTQEREHFTKELRNYGKTGKSMEAEFVTRGGKTRNVLLSASLDGEIISGMAKDITDIRTLERQFIQTQKLEGLGNIAAGIAHDFNNLLGVILGYADLLSQSAFDQKRFQRGTQAIIKSAERGKALVKQLLTFARKTEITFGSVRVNEIVSEIEKLMGETFPKTITVATELRDDLPVILGDSTQIHQVLLNICVNARDAMPKGGKLTISTGVVEGETLIARFPEATTKSYVEIRIEDSGTGMEEETRRRIFEPFFTTKEVGKGTGLGLSVVYGIMQGHRGFVDVASELKKGTTFFVYFPVLEEPIEESEMIDQSSGEISGGTDTVLVIEDEEMLRDLLKIILESKGYRVIMARDGEEGLQIFRRDKDKIAVVLSDLGLPKLSGEEIVSYIKRVDPKVDVIIASGFIDPDVRSALEVAGVRDFIQKPYVAKEVLRVVRDTIDRAKT